MISKLFSNTVLTEKAINATVARNEAIAQNIANIDTPGYKRRTVSFEDQLSGAIEGRKLTGTRTNSKHLPIGSRRYLDADIVIGQDSSNLSMRIDGNNVDIDREMALQAENKLRYDTLIQRISSEFSKLRSAINEGRR